MHLGKDVEELYIAGSDIKFCKHLESIFPLYEGEMYIPYDYIFHF